MEGSQQLCDHCTPCPITSIVFVFRGILLSICYCCRYHYLYAIVFQIFLFVLVDITGLIQAMRFLNDLNKRYSIHSYTCIVCKYPVQSQVPARK